MIAAHCAINHHEPRWHQTINIWENNSRCPTLPGQWETMKNVDSKQFADNGNNEKRWQLTVCRCIKSYDSVMQNMGVASPLKWRGFVMIIINREETWQRRQGSRSNHNSAFIFYQLTAMITSSDSSEGKGDLDQQLYMESITGWHF